MARDIVAELFDKKTRHQGSDGIWRFIDVLNDVRLAYLSLKDKDELSLTPVERQLIRALPILTTAAMESYLRRAFALIVDSGEAARQRLTQFKDVKANFDVLVAVGSGDITLGELSSHILGFGKLEEINKNMSVVLGVDLFSQLDGLCTNEVMADVAKCIEIRNILAHEAPFVMPCSAKEALNYFRSVTFFVFEIENIIKKHVGTLVKDPRDTGTSSN